MIKSNNNKIFGGYINESFKDNGRLDYCKNAFIFSLDKKEKYKQKNNSMYSFCNLSSKNNFLVAFGGNNGNCDIFIFDKCNLQNNFSVFGSSFELPKGLIYFNNESKSYLAGKNEFLVTEIEIYSIELQ